jgi:acyl-CoA thioesterase FadM
LDCAIGNSSLTIRQKITRDGTVLVAIKVVIVAISSAGRPVRLPPQLRQIFGSQNASD